MARFRCVNGRRVKRRSRARTVCRTHTHATRVRVAYVPATSTQTPSVTSSQSHAHSVDYLRAVHAHRNLTPRTDIRSAAHASHTHAHAQRPLTAHAHEMLQRRSTDMGHLTFVLTLSAHVQGEHRASATDQQFKSDRRRPDSSSAHLTAHGGEASKSGWDMHAKTTLSGTTSPYSSASAQSSSPSACAVTN